MENQNEKINTAIEALIKSGDWTGDIAPQYYKVEEADLSLTQHYQLNDHNHDLVFRAVIEDKPSDDTFHDEVWEVLRGTVERSMRPVYKVEFGRQFLVRQLKSKTDKLTVEQLTAIVNESPALEVYDIVTGLVNLSHEDITKVGTK